MCSCAKWVMHGLVDCATLLELHTCVLLDHQELQRCDFVASSAFPSSSQPSAVFIHLYITSWLYTFPILLHCHCLCHSTILSAHTMHGKHSCYLYHVLHGHAVWFSNIHFMLQLRSQFLPHKPRTLIISSHTRHVCLMDNERWSMPKAAWQMWCHICNHDWVSAATNPIRV